MEQFNKALSFILGLVVVAVFIVVASGKFSFKGLALPKSKITGNITPTVTPKLTPKPTSKPWFSFGQPTAKPTVTPKLTPKPTSKPWFSFGTQPTAIPSPTAKPTMPFAKRFTTDTMVVPNTVDPNYHSYLGSSSPTSIPNTGVPIVLFPLFGTSLLSGIFIKSAGKKD
jgi:hypothetical protein